MVSRLRFDRIIAHPNLEYFQRFLMPRYFFDVRDGNTTIDEVGQLVSDLNSARNIAVQILYSLPNIQFTRDHFAEQVVSIRSAEGNQLLRVLMTVRVMQSS